MPAHGRSSAEHACCVASLMTSVVVSSLVVLTQEASYYKPTNRPVNQPAVGRALESYGQVLHLHAHARLNLQCTLPLTLTLPQYHPITMAC